MGASMSLKMKRNDLFSDLSVSIVEKRGIKQSAPSTLSPASKLKAGKFDIPILDGIFFNHNEQENLSFCNATRPVQEYLLY